MKASISVNITDKTIPGESAIVITGRSDQYAYAVVIENLDYTRNVLVACMNAAAETEEEND